MQKVHDEPKMLSHRNNSSRLVAVVDRRHHLEAVLNGLVAGGAEGDFPEDPPNAPPHRALLALHLR